MRAAHGGQLRATGDHRMRGGPNDPAHHEQYQHPLGVLRKALGAGNAPHARPQVIVGGNEEHPDEHGLHDPEPAHEASHHRDAHLLVVLVNLAAEPVAGEGQYDEGRNGDEIADVAHPVVVSTLFIGCRSEEAIGGIRSHNRTAEHGVGNEPMNIDRHPRRVGNRVVEAHRRRQRLGRHSVGG